MTDDIYLVAKKELEIDEELLWYGAPKPKLVTGESIAMLIFGLFFLSFSIFWTFMASSMGAPFFFPLFGLIFVGIGIAIVTSPIKIYKNYQKTVYVITNKRCIIIVCKNEKTVKSYYINDFQNLEKTEYADDTGTIIFAKEMYQTHTDHGYRNRVNKIGFIRIEDVRKVEAILKKITA